MARITHKTGSKLERLALEIEWIQNRLYDAGFNDAADCLYAAKRECDAAGQRVFRELDRRASAPRNAKRRAA